MNNKEILKNVLVTVGLLTISIVALVYFNSKLNEASSHRIVAIAPSATIHPYNPGSLAYKSAPQNRRQADNMTVTGVSELPNTPPAVQAADYPNNLVIHAASNVNTSMATGGNANNSTGSRSNIVQQRQQMNLGALTAVSSRPISTVSSSSSSVSAPFQEATAPSGTISTRDLPDWPDEPFPDEDAPLGEGILVLLFLSAVYSMRQFFKK